MNKINIALATFLTLSTIIAQASDLIEVLPLTHKIIMLRFNDGYATYHKMGQSRNSDRVFVQPLNTEQASLPGSYLLESRDDENYLQQKNPVQVGRKTKGTEFIWMCQAWNNGCINSSPDHVKGHWVYLFFDQPLKVSQTYTLHTGNLAGNGKEWAFTFDPAKIRSEAVHVNQIGYSTHASEKFGYVYHWAGDKGNINLSAYNNKKFFLARYPSREVVFEGIVKFRKSRSNEETGQTNDTPGRNFLGADVYECDFSGFNQTGDYVLYVEEMGCSFPFTIGEDIYREVYYTSIRGLYHNRSGIELKQPYTEFTRAAPHHPEITPGFAGKLQYTTSRFIDWRNGDNDHGIAGRPDKAAIEAGMKGALNTWGWYQDAGDWDGYFTHMNIPLMLMLTWQIAPEKFRDNELNIPESGNGIPDILDEAAWLIRFFHRTRHAIMDAGYGTGGVGSRVCGDHFGEDGEGVPSYKDVNRTWILSGEDPHSTFKYAGLAAQFAICLQKLEISDPEGVDWTKEAREAWQWAIANTLAGDENTKPAMNHHLKDIRAFAAASLYQITGETIYHDRVKADLATLSATTALGDEKKWAPYIYANLSADKETDIMLKTKAMQAVVKTADDQVITAETRACRWGGNFWFPMLVGQGTTPMVFETILAWNLIKETNPAKAQNYMAMIHNTADYFLGNNPLNKTWITGLGLRRPERVFHMDAWYNGKNEMHPGITPYGPWKDDPGFTGQGAWDVKWSYKSIFPTSISVWPGHERWFGNYTSPLNAEFTVHQNTILNAVIYGFLCSTADETFIPNLKPEIETIRVNKINSGDSIRISVVASDPEGVHTLYKAEFYNGWQKIGEASEMPYQIKWLPTSNQMKLKVRVTDILGARTQKEFSFRADTLTSSRTHLKETQRVLVYPNPSNHSFRFMVDNLRNNSVNIMIFGNDGRLLHQSITSATNHFDFIWSPKDSNLPSGTYFYRINLDDEPGHYHSGSLIYQKPN
jgi:endoglucanase